MRLIVLGLLAVALIGAGYLTRGWWRPIFDRSPTESAAEPHHDEATDRVKLSAQARGNLKLIVKPTALGSYRRPLQMPGEVVERRGRGDYSFTAPASGVVSSIASLPGDTVEAGSPLLTLRLTSEAMQTNQLELFKAVLETDIAQKQQKRLESVKETVPQWQIVDVQNQLSRLAASRRAYRADLALKGLTPDQIDRVEKGDFIREIVVRAPVEVDGKKPLLELQELKVMPGDRVDAGQLLGLLSNHQNLFIEGHGFREDTPLLEKTAAMGWPLTVHFPEEVEGAWSPIEEPFTILYISNTVDPTSQTIPFYVQLPNQYREYTREGKTYRIWRFRPGQRVQLGVPVEEFADVFVVPAAAVARDGAEAYVFRQSGDVFHRQSVRILHEDTRVAVLANDGSLLPGSAIAMNGAGALNRILKAQGEQAGGHHHDHDH